MASFRFDQAEGLRRMVAGPRPRVLSVLSSAPGSEKTALLVNLSASLAHAGSSVLLVDACHRERGVAARLKAEGASLMQVVRNERVLADVVHSMPDSFGVVAVTRNPLVLPLAAPQQEKLGRAFDALAQQHDLMLIDAELDAGGEFLLPAITQGEILIQVCDTQASITNAYALIKRLQARLGRRPYSILVSGVTEERAGVVYRNMAQAASRYLAVELHSVGWVPDDEHLKRASRLGRSVVDAFPLAGAAVAFRHLAGHYARSELAPAWPASSALEAEHV